MSNLKQVKVDNWGIYFLQRLKHFFNRTDYCDLTLQFQDNAQLKVHRLVLNACTEYFELLERTCEMYEDCLVMPDDLQADVVVPIVNFMYTGQLEFKVELLDRLHQTSQIMDMPVLTKLLDAQRGQLSKKQLSHTAQRGQIPKVPPTHIYSAKHSKQLKNLPSTSNSNKRSFSKAFQNTSSEKKTCFVKKLDNSTSSMLGSSITPINHHSTNKKPAFFNPRPTRYELPEELDNDEIFDSSFSSISYTSKPLVVHPETTKHYSVKKSSLFSDPSSSKYTHRQSDIECKKITKDDNIYYEDNDNGTDDSNIFDSTIINPKDGLQDSSQLFDNILDNDMDHGPKVTVENKDKNKSIDHAKIISEVLKKYPHLMKGNKNIKLKILNTSATKSKREIVTVKEEMKDVSPNSDLPDYTYESDVLDSKQAAQLIAMGAENVRGPWICLICGTPGRALHFTSYYKFRRHLVEVHNEKPLSTMCEYCGLKSHKRSYLLHHLYTKHGIDPPPQVNFPKCTQCSYVALTEGYLIKHKMTHTSNRTFNCNICSSTFTTSSQLLAHIQLTGHKYSADRKANLQCIYCMKVFLRESNLVAHLKTNHKEAARNDGIIEESEEESTPKTKIMKNIKCEPVTNLEIEYDVSPQYQIHERSIPSQTKKHVSNNTLKQKILNSGIDTQVVSIKSKSKAKPHVSSKTQEYYAENISPTNEEILVIGDNEYIMRDNQLIPKKSLPEEFILSDQPLHSLTPSTSTNYTNINNTCYEEIPQGSKVMKKATHQPIQIVVSNEEEYKALMSSNHSIIFDNADTSKTLTVLSAPHNSMTSAAMDIDTSQSNEMVIIPDNYPLNVTEAVTGNNSNIVVVYSHPVDQSKPYHLITSQGLESQFVQTTDIITQNYEAITNSTPVTSTEILNNQESWSDTNNQETIEIENQVITEIEQTEIVPSNQNENDSLPEVHLESGKLHTPLIQDDNPNHHNNIHVTDPVVITHNTDSPVLITHMTDAPVVITHNTDAVNEESTTHEESEIEAGISTDNIAPVTEEIELEHSSNAEQTSVIVTNDQEGERKCLEEHSENKDDSLFNESTMETKTDNAIPETGTIVEHEEPNQSQDHREVAVIVPNNNDKIIVQKSEKQIQSLTSEWSDDDEAQDPNESNTFSEKESLVIVQSTQSEESIENIQQEVDRVIDPSSETTKGDETLEVPEKIISQEKISSLLNDWEENDSQEENPIIEEQKLTNEVVDVGLPQNTEKQNLDNSNTQQNGNNIKSLVSDWDEEEEEIKE